MIEQHRGEIRSICERHHVRRLELFGSAAGSHFDASRSDLDFFVEFLSYESPTIADQWFGLQEDLQALLGYDVDLTSLHAAKNPYFLQVANRQRVTLYAA
ncbi:MAG TPA: nucleotidyltransferase domain-containing protein [Tepidisphaeraceae bacterium]|nr:nucleotidyltransferase domain-containing protein [Tepidisphaeraceae bacterium]